MNYVEGKDKNKILEGMKSSPAVPGSPGHEQQKAGIMVRCTEDIEKALNTLTKQLSDNDKSSQIVSGRIFWLNIVLAIAAVIGAAATAVMAFK